MAFHSLDGNITGKDTPALIAYVDGFEHDIFISYVRVNDLPDPGTGEGWVTSFLKYLEKELAERVGRIGLVRIWRDLRRIDGIQLFDQTIEEGINTSAVFLALTSNGYLASDYCRKELTHFHRKASAERLTVGNRVRIANVLLNNVPREKWPEEFGRTSGFTFHDAEHDDQFGEPSEPGSALFKQQLRTLADALYGLLKAMKEAKQPVPRQTDATEAVYTVFLADVPDTLRKRKRLVIADLKRNNIDVIADIPPPYDEAGHDRRVIEVLQSVDLSVHLLDAWAGREIDGREDRTYLQQQADLALEHAAAPMIWTPHKLDIDGIDDETHQTFMKKLKGDERVVDFIRANPADITQIILEKIEQLQSATEAAATADSCLLVTHAKDLNPLLQMAAVLNNNGIQPLINQEGDEPEAVLNLFDERLHQVANLIIIYGKVARYWVRERLDIAIKMAANEDLVINMGVFAPMKTPEEANFSRGVFQVRVLGKPDDALSFLGKA